MTAQRKTVKLAAAQLLLAAIESVNAMSNDDVAEKTGVPLDEEKRKKFVEQVAKLSASMSKRLAKIVNR